MRGDRLLGGLDRAAQAAAGHATTFGYLSGWRFVRVLPESAAQRLFRRIGDEVHRRNGASVRRLRGNLARVAPALDEEALERLTRDAVRSYMRYWCESFRMPSWPIDDMVRRVHTVNEPMLRAAMSRGRGVVAPLPHTGNWDWAGAWACGTGMPLVTVAERLEPERLYDEFVAYRRRLGMEILPLDGDDRTFRRLVEQVRSGGLVCLLADRDMSGNGVEVTLCGHRVRMPKGPAVIARMTGAALIPVTLAYDGPDMELTLHDEIPHQSGPQGVAAMMQSVADAFTVALRAQPQDWHMMQRIFLDEPTPEGG